ncbi:MAG: PAS domain-containing protein [Gemmatimonadaceae bacterium]|nr:PAS domain-containing protein [Gemmatimonadaceae bacterium]
MSSDPSAPRPPHPGADPLPLENRLRLLEQVVVQANEAVVITEAEPIDLPGPRIVFVNDAFTRLTGYEAHEVLGRTPRLFQSERTNRATLDEIRACMARWQPFRGEVLNRHKDGTHAWIDLSIVPVADERGWFTHWVAIQRDVTARRTQQEAVARSEARLQLALRATRMATFDVDVATRAVRWDADATALLQSTGTHLLHDAGGATLGSTIDAMVGEALAGDGPVTRTIALASPEPEPRMLECTVLAVRDERGTVTGCIGTVRDVSQQVGAERRAVAAAARLRRAQRLARLGNWEMELTRGVVTWSSEMAQFFGRDPALGAPRTDEYFGRYLRGADEARVREALAEVLRTRRPAQVEHRVHRDDGTIGHLVSTCEPGVERDGRLETIVGVSLDITDLRRQGEALEASNVRLLSAQRLAGLGAWTVDLATGRSHWSREMCEINGLEPTDAALPAEVVLAAVHPDDRAKMVETIRTAAAQDAPIALEYRIRRADGEERIASSVGQGVRDASGRTIAVTGALLDVTEQRRTERRLMELKEAAEAAARARSQFLAKVSHELRTPMNGVLGTLDLLRDTTLDAHQGRLTEIARGSADSLLRLLNDLLDFAQLEAGRVAIRDEPFALHDALRDVVQLLQPRAAAKGLALALDVEPALPLVMRGDDGRLRQVLLNLVGNAIKFTARGRVTVRARHVAGADAARLRIEVSDTGIGIAPDRRDALFTPFSQVHDAGATTEAGAGLGLSICRDLVERMGGTLDLVAHDGPGCTFACELPIRAEEAAAAASAPVPATSSALDDLDLAPLRGRHVLVAEDHPVNRLVIERHLAALGLTVSVAEDGAAAVSAARCERFDAILMDWQMPVLDGIAATKRIRLDEGVDGRAPVPIIAVTANVYDADRATARAAGMTGFIAKPFGRRELARVLLAAVGVVAAPAPH